MTTLPRRFLHALDRFNAGHPWDHNAHYHRWIMRQLPRSFPRALDVGSGTGDLARLLATRAAAVDAIDSRLSCTGRQRRATCARVSETRPCADARALEEERRALEQRRDRLRTRLDLLGELAADLPREIGEGAGAGEFEGQRWDRELDRVNGERDAYGEELRVVKARRRRRELGRPWSWPRRSPPSWSATSR
ncbi:hypothetical protein AB0L50_36100 [Streptomyces flaveolus]|uniref:hypothetical protein n=1 Tax=Streptomyces flaveolus TaxID=67297 RepID=UPI00343D2AE3